MKLIRIYFVLVFIFLAIAGCSSKKEQQPLSRLESERKIIQILENDHNLKPVAQWEGDTFWIYIPIEKPLFAIAASGTSRTVEKKYILQFVESIFNNSTLEIEYDVVPAFKMAPPNGITNRYTQTFNNKYQNITNALSRAFFTAKNPPKFIVVIIADIKDGIEMMTTFYTEDLKKYQSGALPADEYMVRIHNEPYGADEIKNDKEGKHVESYDIKMRDFVSRQIKNRINFKFQNSDFPPDKNYEDEIIDAIIKTFHAYDFNDFSSVSLSDLRQDKKQTLSFEKIKKLQDPLPKEKASSEGKVITIDFSDMIKGLKKDSDQ